MFLFWSRVSRSLFWCAEKVANSSGRLVDWGTAAKRRAILADEKRRSRKK